MENSKQYLIQFIASMQGDKLIINQLHSIESQTEKMTKSMGGATKSMGNSMMSLAKRALMVAPIWMLLRGAIMMVTSTVKEAIQANIAFQENMARIKTVVTASSDSVEQDMTQMRTAILETATNSRISLGELAEGMYFLRTAGLTTEESIGAFASTVATATGTTNSLKDTTRIVVGIYNTMGKSLGDNLSVHEKFQKINDALTYTYATQEVQLQELGQSYLQFAPYLSGLSDDFIDMITMLGFLNTKMLKAGRAGRMTGMAILQLSKKTQQLAEIFGITFDPDKPINFLDTLKQMVSALGETEKLTKGQSEAIAKLFEARAGVPLRILIDNYKEFIEVIERARKENEGFAETMKGIMEHTVTAQMARFKNIIAVSTNELFSAAAQGADFVQVLKNMNDALDRSRKDLKDLAYLINYLTFNYGKATSGVKGFIDKIRELSGIDMYEFAKGPAGAILAYSGILEKLGAFKLVSKVTGFDKHIDKIKKDEEEVKKIEEARAKFKKLELNITQRIQEEHRHELAIAKERGASELEIAELKFEQLEYMRGLLTADNENLENLKTQNNLVEAHLKTRNQVVNTVMKAQVSLLKAQGLSELQIIQAQETQLRNQSHLLSDEVYALRLMDLKISKAIELTNAKQKELNIQRNIAIQYLKADPTEKGRIRRATELRGMQSTPQLISRFKSDLYDQKIILEYWSLFTEKQQEALGDAAKEITGLNFMKAPPLEDKLTPEIKRVMEQTEHIQKFWLNFTELGRKEVDEINKYIKTNLFPDIGEGFFTPPTTDYEQLRALLTPKPATLPTFPSVMALGVEHDLKIDFKIDADSLEAIPERIGREVEELLNKDDFVKRLSRRLREII
jgi:TP901 family phage tail tape measure protein